jgi:outer membrane protein assembly factor BamB
MMFASASTACGSSATPPVATAAPNAAPGLIVTALQPRDGSAIWQQVLPNQELFGPARYSDGSVFVIGGLVESTAVAYTLTAYHAISGPLLWQQALGTGTLLGSAAGDGGVYISLSAGHLLAMLGPTTRGAAPAAPGQHSPFGDTLTAYRASGGTQLWHVSGFTPAHAEIGGTLYTTNAVEQAPGKASFTVIAYQAATGAQLWLSSLLGEGGITQDKPFVTADAHAAYVFNMPETQPSVHALIGTSGTPLWTALPDGAFQFGVAGGNMVFTAALPTAASGQPPQTTTLTLYALQSSLGELRWQLPLESSVQVRLALV